MSKPSPPWEPSDVSEVAEAITGAGRELPDQREFKESGLSRKASG